MPVTAGGTAYTVRTAAVSGHGNVYWGVADSIAGTANIPTVLYAHGAGGGPDQFTTSAAWDGLRDWMIDHSWAYIEGGGGDTDLSGETNWGNDEARTAYPAYIGAVEGTASVPSIGKLVLLGRSMGGLITLWLYAYSSLKPRVSGMMMNSGVSTLLYGDQTPPSSSTVPPVSSRPTGVYFGTTLLPAHGVPDYATLYATKQAYAPETWPASVWTGAKILSLYGDADTTVPWSTRGGEPMRTLWAGEPVIDLVDLRSGGDHSAGNGSYLQVSAMTSFLTSITPPIPAPPGTVLRTIKHFLIRDGQSYLMEPVRSTP